MKLWKILHDWQEEGWTGVIIDEDGREYDLKGEGCVISTYLDEEFTIKEEKQDVIVNNLNITVNSANLTAKEFIKSIEKVLKNVGIKVIS